MGKILVTGQQLKGLARCVHCSIAVPLLINRGNFNSNNIFWQMYECQGCNNVILVKADGQRGGTTPFENKIYEIYPTQKSVAPELPEKAIRYLEQAISSIHAPDGAVMLAGSAIDAMLKKLELTDGSIYHRIGEAVEKGILTSDMALWAHAVRIESNKPRHADENDPHMGTSDAERVIEFTQMLGHILFTLPEQVRAGKKKADSTGEIKAVPK